MNDNYKKNGHHFDSVDLTELSQEMLRTQMKSGNFGLENLGADTTA